VTALQPPSRPPTPSVNPDPSAFGTGIRHAENRTTDPTTGDVQTDATTLFLVPAGNRYVDAGDPNHMWQVPRRLPESMPPHRQQPKYALPHQLVSSVTLPVESRPHYEMWGNL